MADLIDRELLGRMLRGARIMAGFDSVADASKAISEVTGFKVTDRTLYQLERGEQAITLEQVLAIMLVYHPPGGTSFFDRAYSQEMQEMAARARAEDVRGVSG